MSGSVWLTEVDTGLLKLIPTIVKCYDENGELRPVDVMVRNPEGEYKIETFPSVSIFNYGQSFADERYDKEDVFIELDKEAGEAIYEKSALPYNLYYQIDFWANYNEDINEMTRRWIGQIEKRSLLEVIDTKGNTRFSNMELLDYANVDFVRGEERVFHRTYSYRIWVELDEQEPITKKVVTERELRRGDMSD